MYIHEQLLRVQRLKLLQMSYYLKSLREAEQDRYVAKLEAAGLSLQDDLMPQQMTATFRRLASSLSMATFQPGSGIYTQEQFLSWKQLDSYDYF